MTERIFKNKLITELRKNFFHVIDLSMIGTSTGCPDLHISKNNKFILAELKIIPSIRSNILFKSFFEKSQFIFYEKYNQFNSNIYFILYSKKEKSVFCIYCHSDSVYREQIFNKTLQELFKMMIPLNNIAQFCSKETQYIFGFETRKAE